MEKSLGREDRGRRGRGEGIGWRGCLQCAGVGFVGREGVLWQEVTRGNCFAIEIEPSGELVLQPAISSDNLVSRYQSLESVNDICKEMMGMHIIRITIHLRLSLNPGVLIGRKSAGMEVSRGSR